MSVSIYMVQYHAPTKKAPHYWCPLLTTACHTRREALVAKREWKQHSPHARYRVWGYLPFDDFKGGRS